VDTVSVTKISYREAIAEALRIEFGRDPSLTCIAGEASDWLTDGLEELYGADCLLTLAPAERTVVGIAVGMALEGSRPICEIGAAELPSRGLDQLAEAAELHHRDGIAVPLVLRLPCGTPSVDGPPDAEGPERWLLSIPGLSVVAPASAADAKGLLVSAIRDPGPVCFLEQVGLYGAMQPVPEGGHVVPIGESRLVREGTRMTVIAYGSGVAPAAQAAAELNAGIEVLDLRTLAPLDHDGIVGSVRRTGKALLVDEAANLSSVARAVTATLWDDAFEYLDAPLRRVSLTGAAAEPGERPAAWLEAVKEACDELLSY
jgi:pyruvate/2-oxoglutarate/acetoin dehydrogenase E1 component